MLSRLYLIRHAAVEGRFQGRYLGRNDVSLSQSGILQARALGPELRALLKDSSCPVWLSPLRRCRETWLEMGLESDPIVKSELAEVDFGAWDGKSFQEIADSDPARVAQWGAFDPHFRFPEGESLGEFGERAKRVRDQLLELDACEAILVSHGGVIAALICLFLGLEPAQYLAFQIERASIASVAIFKNGLGRLNGLNLGRSEIRRSLGGEWPG